MDSAAWPAAQPSASDYAQRRGSAPADLADLARAGKYPGYDQQPRASHGAYESPRYDDPQQYARAPAQQQQQQQGMLYGYDQRFDSRDAGYPMPQQMGMHPQQQHPQHQMGRDDLMYHRGMYAQGLDDPQQRAYADRYAYGAAMMRRPEYAMHPAQQVHPDMAAYLAQQQEAPGAPRGGEYAYAARAPRAHRDPVALEIAEALTEVASMHSSREAMKQAEPYRGVTDMMLMAPRDCSNRGRYRCGRCGQIKVNHNCMHDQFPMQRSLAIQTEPLHEGVADEGDDDTPLMVAFGPDETRLTVRRWKRNKKRARSVPPLDGEDGEGADGGGPDGGDDDDEDDDDDDEDD
mmetsp:Transcript_23652/g.79817  ORF Transcript_23652/g.79817 Transcript_23652/m.79817 type:complete len:347 (-) Transcript_23652:185-1225(-)